MTTTELCACGRPLSQTHCPRCGSYSHYGLASRIQHVVFDGQQKAIYCYRCRKCSHVFNDLDALKCAAPLVITLEKRIENEAVEEVKNLTYAQREAWMKAQLSKRGATPVRPARSAAEFEAELAASAGKNNEDKDQE